MTRSNRLFVALCSSLVVLCALGAHAVAAQTVPAETHQNLYDDYSYSRAIAEAAADHLMETLGRELKSAMARGGAISAIHVCSNRAQAITDSLSQVHNMTLRRVSERFRNPNDAPTDLEKHILARFAESNAPADTIFPVGEGETRAYLYLRPIRIKGPVCLRCHGNTDRIAPDVLDKLAALYPDDRATGYKLKDLRGAFSVRVPVPTGPESDKTKKE